MIGSRVSVGPEFCHQVAWSWSWSAPLPPPKPRCCCSAVCPHSCLVQKCKSSENKKYKNTKTRKFFSANICKNTNTRSRSMPTTKTQVLLCCLPTQSMNSRQEDGRRDPEFLMNLPKSGQINSNNCCIVYFV